MEAQFYSFWLDVLAMALELSSLNEFRFIGRRWERHMYKDDGITGTGIVQERSWKLCDAHDGRLVASSVQFTYWENTRLAPHTWIFDIPTVKEEAFLNVELWTFCTEFMFVLFKTRCYFSCASDSGPSEGTFVYSLFSDYFQFDWTYRL